MSFCVAVGDVTTTHSTTTILEQETLRVNLNHFLRTGQVEECFERSRYDQFLSFLDKSIFNHDHCHHHTNDNNNNTPLFISNGGIHAIYNTLFVLNRRKKNTTTEDDATSPILCMKRCMIITLGMLYRNEAMFNEKYWTIITHESNQQQQQHQHDNEMNDDDDEIIIENSAFKNYLIEMLKLNNDGDQTIQLLDNNGMDCEFTTSSTMNSDDIDFLKTSIFNSLCTFLDCHPSSMHWFITNNYEMNCFESIFKHNIRSENIYLRQSCIQCLLLVIQYYFSHNNNQMVNCQLNNENRKELVMQQFMNILESFKKENLLEYLEFVLQLVTLCFNDHNSTFDFTMMRPLSAVVLEQVLIETKLIESLIRDESISETHDLRVVERLYDILIYLSNHHSNDEHKEVEKGKMINSLLKLSGQSCDSIGHTIEIIKLCLLSNDCGFQDIGIKIISNFSKDVLMMNQQHSNEIVSLISIVVSMWQSLIFKEGFDSSPMLSLPRFSNFSFMSVKQRGKFILGITKCLTRFVLTDKNDNGGDGESSISSLFNRMNLQATIIETAKMYDHINNPLCSKVLELLYGWSYHHCESLKLSGEHLNYLWFLFHNSLVPKTFSVVSKIIPLLLQLDDDDDSDCKMFSVISDRCLDMNWEIRDSVIDFISFVFSESANHSSYLSLANSLLCVKSSTCSFNLIKLIDQKLNDKEHFVVLTTLKALYSLILFMVRTNNKRENQLRTNDVTTSTTTTTTSIVIQYLIKIFETANRNTEYFIKKEAIEICKNLLSNRIVMLSDLLDSSTMIKCLASVVEFSSMECDVEVANQFLQLCNSIVVMSGGGGSGGEVNSIEQVLQFLIEINSQSIIKEYFDNSMVESNNNLSISIIENLYKRFETIPSLSSGSVILQHSFCEFIRECHNSLVHQQHHHHQHQQDDQYNHNNIFPLVQDFFNFDNDDYDCQCC